MIFNKYGSVVANSAYLDSEKIGKNINITLPAITFATQEIQGMGPMTIPSYGQVESMELIVSLSGIDPKTSQIGMPGRRRLEFRWFQSVLNGDAFIRDAGCKAYLTALPKSLPSFGLGAGGEADSEIAFETLRYQLFVDGKELWLIDKINDILRINGHDYAESMRNFL